MENELIPEQKLGSEMDAQSETVCSSLAQALDFYQEVKNRLYAVNDWHKVCNTSATIFQLTTKDGAPITTIGEGCLIRIDIPGPGTTAGDGYDWVRVEKIAKSNGQEAVEWAGFTVRPCPNPFHPSLGTAHFFSDSATSTFIVSRNGHTVMAEMHGRNEVPNGETDRLFDGLRNTMVGWTAKIGLSYPQWKFLVEGLVSAEE